MTLGIAKNIEFVSSVFLHSDIFQFPCDEGWKHIFRLMAEWAYILII